MSTSLIRGLLVLMALSRVAFTQCASWDSAFIAPGANDQVNALAVFDDGSGPTLYAGGFFTLAGSTSANRIAKWNGEIWSALGSGISGTNSPSVNALAVFDDGSGPALYVGGSFSFYSGGGAVANHIARWNGTSWSALGAGMDAVVRTLAVFDDGSGPALYAGGDFTAAGVVSAVHIARWNGSTWSPLSTGMNVNSSVYALEVFDDGSGPALYAGGSFSIAGGTSALRVAKWNGSFWSALHGGITAGNAVYALRVFDDGSGSALYAGGNFTMAAATSASDIAKWNGTTWSALGSGLNNQVNALAVLDDGSGPALFAGGAFTTAGGTGAASIAKWSSSSWSALGSGMNGSVNALGVFDDGSGPTLCAGGNFTVAGGTGAWRIAKWSGASWSAVSSGGVMNNYVQAFEVFNDGSGPALYAAGRFTTAGSTLAKGIAKWNGTSWSAVGGGIDVAGTAGVFALKVFDGGDGPRLYAGGNFTTAEGTTVNGIAKWNGLSWTALGSGVGGSSAYVFSLEVFDDGSGAALYAGGLFTTAGGISVDGFAKWNGSAWSAVSTNAIGGLFKGGGAMTVFDDGSGPLLYAAGSFTPTGGSATVAVAKWNGAMWTPLGSGMDDSVFALQGFDDGSGPALYAGGWFLTAGGTLANCIAKWNGTSWSALGSGMGTLPGLAFWVGALRVFDDGSGPALFAGGNFTTAGGTLAQRIAKWDGANWSGLTSQLVAWSVSALQVFDDGLDADADLFVGGDILPGNGAPSLYIAKWNGCGATGFCFGDGSFGPCPCANNGSEGHGCDNSSANGGSRLYASGVASLATDSVRFTASGETPTASSILVQGHTQVAATPFGQGLRCVGGNLERLYLETAAGGVFSAPTGAEPSVHARSASLGDVISAGSSRYYFAYYRDPTVLGGCSPASTFNATPGVRLIWSP